MSGILRHISAKDLKKTHQKKLSEQKERAAQKLKEWQEAEVERKQIEEIARPYKSDWRSELNEMMTTNGMVVTYIAPEGQVDLSTATPTFTFTGSDPSGFHADSKLFGRERIRYDTVVVRVNSTSSEWTLRPEGQGFDPDEYTNGFASGGSGGHTVVIPFDERLTGLFYMARDDGNVTFTTTFQRRSPVNVFVPLDDPEATSFIRGGLGGDKERRKRLKDMLDASNELMIRLGLEPSKTSPGDIRLAQALPYTDMDDAFDDPYYTDPVPDLDDDSDFPDLDIPLAKGKGDKIAGVPRNYPGEGAVPAYPSPRGPYTPIKNYGSDKNPKFMPSGPPINPYRLA